MLPQDFLREVEIMVQTKYDPDRFCGALTPSRGIRDVHTLSSSSKAVI